MSHTRCILVVLLAVSSVACGQSEIKATAGGMVKDESGLTANHIAYMKSFNGVVAPEGHQYAVYSFLLDAGNKGDLVANPPTLLRNGIAYDVEKNTTSALESGVAISLVFVVPTDDIAKESVHALVYGDVTVTIPSNIPTCNASDNPVLRKTPFNVTICSKAL